MVYQPDGLIIKQILEQWQQIYHVSTYNGESMDGRPDCIVEYRDSPFEN